MFHPWDQLSKGLLRDALSRSGSAQTEVEVLAATQRIDVYSLPDPSRAAQRAEMGLLGELSAVPSQFESFRNTVTVAEFRRCQNKQLSWHHELQRRSRATAGHLAQAAPELPDVPLPTLVITSPGRPTTLLEAGGFVAERSGVYAPPPLFATQVIVLSELPRTRETLYLRLLGRGRVLREALEELAALPTTAWERSIASPLLLHFHVVTGDAPKEEADVTAEIQAWYDDFQRQQAQREAAARDSGRASGERNLLSRQLRVKFGELSPAARGRIEAAEPEELERWAERVLGAQTLDEVFADTH